MQHLAATVHEQVSKLQRCHRTRRKCHSFGAVCCWHAQSQLRLTHTEASPSNCGTLMDMCKGLLPVAGYSADRATRPNLWAGKAARGSGGGLNQWDRASLGDAAKTQKFQRMMGTRSAATHHDDAIDGRFAVLPSTPLPCSFFRAELAACDKLTGRRAGERRHALGDRSQPLVGGTSNLPHLLGVFTQQMWYHQKNIGGTCIFWCVCPPCWPAPHR
jgi:hypothetical protein